MSTEKSNKGIIFAEVPTGLPELGKHFKWDERKIDLSSIVLEKGEILVKNLYMSLDPYMRGRMRPKHVKSYVDPYNSGDIIDVGCVSVVVKSNHDQWKEGDFYFGFSGWEEYTKLSSEAANRGVFSKSSIKNAVDNNIPLSYFLGLLGMPGLTAYVGLFMIGKPKKGETIFISTAAGAVGQVAAQIAKIKGLKVIGSTGDDSKVDYLLNELKIDHAFNYKKVDLQQTLKEICPEGIDIYFDNVGGETLDIVLAHLNDFARVISCGMISQYTATEQTIYGIKNLMRIIPRRVLIQGFIVRDHFTEYFEPFQKEMSQWLKEGKLKFKEHVVNGVEEAPEAFLGLFEGKNLGKLLVKLGDLN